MVYYVHYKKSSRDWGQHTLGDYYEGLDEQHRRILDTNEDLKWKAKKAHYQYLKKQGVKNLPSLRRGRKKKIYPTKEHYYMDNSRDVAEIKQFPWFSRLWIKKANQESARFPKVQLRLDTIIHQFGGFTARPHISSLYLPHFRMPRYVEKDDFCSAMDSWAWDACHLPTRKVGFVSHIFYLNSFDGFDDIDFMDAIEWPRKALPSDLIKFELHRLLQGFESINDYFRMYELSPIIMDPHSINMTHAVPSPNHFPQLLKKIGIEKVREFFYHLVAEARQLGLVRDIVHIWDGQFHETWLKKDKSRRQGHPQFYGGTYNHQGKNVGIGVYQSTIMDWNGYCAIPIHTEIDPANRNENPVLRETVERAYYRKPFQKIPDFFLADRGPSGKNTQDKIWNLGAIPIIPLKSNITKDVAFSADNKHRFYKKYVGQTPGELLNKLYNMRTRIEEHYSFNDTVYNSARLHCMGKELTHIEIILLNCLGVLIPLTAYKIGRPDLMWSPSQFRSHKIHPEEIFSKQFHELEQMRWDDTVSVSPRRYIREKVKQTKDF